MRVKRFENARSFSARAESWLLKREAEHNLILGIVEQLLSDKHVYEPPIYLSTIEKDGAVVGCAFRTPPFGVGLTEMPDGAIPVLVDDLFDMFGEVPTAVGPPSAVERFSQQWAERTGCRTRVFMRQRIYQLTAVIFPKTSPSGSLRLARPEDLSFLEEWAASFVADTKVARVGNKGMAKRLIDDGALYLWDDGQPRCMAAARGSTPHGIRIGFVYTPDAFRRKGYATVCVAALSQLQLDRGLKFCFLYTDLTNPTSNSIYRGIGYRAVCDSLMTEFTSTD